MEEGGGQLCAMEISSTGQMISAADSGGGIHLCVVQDIEQEMLQVVGEGGEGQEVGAGGEGQVLGQGGEGQGGGLYIRTRHDAARLHRARRDATP